MEQGNAQTKIGLARKALYYKLKRGNETKFPEKLARNGELAQKNT
jgi:hypothetical protein